MSACANTGPGRESEEAELDELAMQDGIKGVSSLGGSALSPHSLTEHAARAIAQIATAIAERCPEICTGPSPHVSPHRLLPSHDTRSVRELASGAL